MLGLGQLLADVERAARQRVPLGHAVHAHESFPYLGRFHGFLQDAYTMELPPELAPIMGRLVRKPPPRWFGELTEQVCVVARASAAQPEERAFARLMVFEAIRVSLGFATYRSNGGFEGVGGCRRDLDHIASDQLEHLLRVPLAVDAREPYRPLLLTVAAAMSRLTAHAEQLRELQHVVRDLEDATHHRAELEMRLREADPIDAAIVRNRLAAGDHQQPIPLQRLPLEHPALLAGQTKASLQQRSSRAVRKLKTKGPAGLRRAKKPLTLVELLLHPEVVHA